MVRSALLCMKPPKGLARGLSLCPLQASRKTKKKEGGALRAQRASSNVFSNFEQTQIQEFKEVRLCLCRRAAPPPTPSSCPGALRVLSRWPGDPVGALPRAVRVGAGPHWAASFQAFTLMDQNRDGFIDKEDLKDTYASLGGCRQSSAPAPAPPSHPSAFPSGLTPTGCEEGGQAGEKFPSGVQGLAGVSQGTGSRTAERGGGWEGHRCPGQGESERQVLPL